MQFGSGDGIFLKIRTKNCKWGKFSRLSFGFFKLKSRYRIVEQVSDSTVPTASQQGGAWYQSEWFTDH